MPQTIQPFDEANFQFSTPQDFSITGDYSITVNVNHPADEYENNDTLNIVVSKIQQLDGAISIEELDEPFILLDAFIVIAETVPALPKEAVLPFKFRTLLVLVN